MRLVTLFLCLILVSIFDIEAQVISLDSQNTNHFTITKNEQKRFSFVNSIVNVIRAGGARGDGGLLAP